VRRTAFLLAAAAAVLAVGAAQGRPAPGPQVEVVVTLGARPVGGRSLASERAQRVDRMQTAFLRRLHAAIPDAHVHWRYRTVLDGFALVLPAREVPRLASLAGVQDVYRGVRYHARAVSGPNVTGLAKLLGPAAATAGDGIKIGIIDDGVDQTHPFLSPRGFTMPPGFPKGDTAYTTAKVIVARAFPPPSPASKYAGVPFDPQNSFHATHVAGIAAGDYQTRATLNGQATTISGIAPRAYIGNYKALTIPTPGFGLDGNSAEIAAAIEAAVNDGMNVINLSLGEPEVTPKRDLVVRAIEGAAAAGVVPVIAAGNDFLEFGRGSVGSPGSAPDAITVAAVDQTGTIAGFSSSGPTPVSLEMKPDVAAPGSDVLSSVPQSQGTWAVYQGTSMASPHVAGAVAVLKQRHPDWSPAELKSALVQTATDAYLDPAHTRVAPTTRMGGGEIDLAAADAPLLFAAPTGISFGLVRPGTAPVERSVTLGDAGGGAGDWTVAVVEQQTHDPAVRVTVPATVPVPGKLAVTATVNAGAAEGDRTGFVVLSNGTVTRRIPFWLHVEVPRLGPPTATLTRTGTYTGDTRRGHARVSSYRYPDDPAGSSVTAVLAGPEQVFRVRITRAVANFGVAVTGGARVQPRVVAAGDENRLTGYPGLPLNLNPYESWYGRRQPVAGAILPAPGVYDVVFDTATRAQAGRFTFRFWIDDTKPPVLRLLTRHVVSRGSLKVSAVDAGAGVDPATLQIKIDGQNASGRLRNGTISIPVGPVAAGSHTLTVSAADFQEAKNMEDVARILPNTATLSTTFTVP
jgi:subtilisin family serine protease